MENDHELFRHHPISLQPPNDTKFSHPLHTNTQLTNSHHFDVSDFFQFFSKIFSFFLPELSEKIILTFK